MSRILIVTFGSLGDLHPAIALATELRSRGHDVTIGTNEPYRVKVTAHGLTFAAVRPDLSLTDQALVRRVMNGSWGSEYLMRKLVFPQVRAMHADLAALAKRTDLMVSSELACAAPLVGETLRVPWAYFGLSPLSFFAVHDPPLLPGPPGLHVLQSLGPAANRFVLTMARTISHGWWRPVRELRAELGLARGRTPLFEGKFSPQLNLAMFSSVLQRPQPDWPSHTVQTGFLFHDETTELPAEVETFLAAGDPPLVFTLGSAAVALAKDFYADSARAAESLGRRAVLLLGKNPPPPRLPPSILAWDYLPYAAIFPRAAAIVHQGGVGTTAQALRAGRPMLILPFAHDQFDNAARITRLGAGRAIARSRYTARTAARELGSLLESSAVRAATEAAAARIQHEDAPAAACTALERLLG